MGSLRKFGGVSPPPVSEVQGMAASNKNTPPGMVPPSNVRKVLPPPQVSDAGAAAQKSQPPQLPFSKQAQIEEMMNPQHRPLTQELVQMAMAKTAERVALLEESDRQRGLPPTAKVASDETDESIGTDFAEKLASAVEFILPEVQAKEAGALESIGNAVRKGGGALAEKGIDVGWSHGRLGKAMQAVGERAGNVTNSQIRSGLKGTAMVAGGALAGAGATKAISHKEAGAKFDKAKDAVKGVAGKVKDMFAKAEGPQSTKKKFQAAGTVMGGGSGGPGKVEKGMPEALKSNAEKVKDKFSGVAGKAKEKAMAAASSFKKNVGSEGGKKIDDLKEMRKDFQPDGKNTRNNTARKILESEITKQRVKTHGGRAAVGGAAAGAAAIAGKKIHEKATEKKAFSVTERGHKFDAEMARVKERHAADRLGLHQAYNAVGSKTENGNLLSALRFGPSIPGPIDVLFNPSGPIGEARHQAHIARQHEAGGNSYNPLGGLMTPSKYEKGGDSIFLGKHDAPAEHRKEAEDAINPAHISGKASPLAAAPTRTETGQDGPSAQGNTGALSSNAAAIAFSNAKNQGMKAEQLRKYFSNPASSQHGDPALGKNFAHKTASDKVAEAQHILSALAAQVEGK